MNPAVDVLVLNWNGRDDTIACLESLCGVAYDRMRIVVVDNGSSDGSIEAIRARFPQVHMVETGRNLGYAGGNNAGLRWCLEHEPGDFLLLLNNDTVVDPTFLARLVRFATVRSEVGIVGPKIYFEDRRDLLWFRGARWMQSRSDFVHVGRDQRDAPNDDLAPTAYITGCALLVRRDVLERVGLLDERFFLLYEEVDLCFRARRAGFDCALVSDAVVWHKVSSTMGADDSPLPLYFHARNRLLFGELHLPFSEKARLWRRVVCETLFPRLRTLENQDAPLVRRLYWLLRKGELVIRSDYRQAGYRARLRGALDYLRRRFGDCPPEIRELSRRRTAAASQHVSPV